MVASGTLASTSAASSFYNYEVQKVQTLRNRQKQVPIVPSAVLHAMADVSEDWRVRVGRERREKMRERLLQAVLTCYANAKQHEAPSIEDVIKEAEVSRGTFYLYFLSLEEAVNALGLAIAEETVRNMASLLTVSETPLQHLATGIQLFLLRSVTDAKWAAFGSRTDFLSRDTTLRKAQQQHLIAAREAKALMFNEVEAATSLMNGAMQEAMRHLVLTDERHRSFVEETTVMILCGLRADYETAKKVVHERAIFIRGLAPDCFPWWSDPWR